MNPPVDHDVFYYCQVILAVGGTALALVFGTGLILVLWQMFRDDR